MLKEKVSIDLVLLLDWIVSGRRFKWIVNRQINEDLQRTKGTKVTIDL